MSSFQHHVAPSVIAERKRRAEQAEERRAEREEARARADALMATYHEMDLATKRGEAAARLRSEEALLEHYERERLAQLRADRLEEDQAIESRAQKILREREALLDPQLASAYVTDDAVPRLQGDAPRMGSPRPEGPVAASAIPDVATLYVSKRGSARIVRLPSDPDDRGRVLDEQLDRLYDSHRLDELLAAGDWEPVAGVVA